MKSFKKHWKTYLAWIAGTEAVGALSSLLTQAGSEYYNQAVQKPALSPPPIVFPIAWGLLYALMGIGAARIWLGPPRTRRTGSLALYGLQLAFNFCWSLIFFNARAYGWALIWLAALWLLILWMTLSFSELDRPAAWLQVPYLAWVLFAGYLNYGVWVLNR